MDSDIDWRCFDRAVWFGRRKDLSLLLSMFDKRKCLVGEGDSRLTVAVVGGWDVRHLSPQAVSWLKQRPTLSLLYEMKLKV